MTTMNHIKYWYNIFLHVLQIICIKIIIDIYRKDESYLLI